ncbi:MAG: hypothetical protein JWP88_856, partial [Flaviaesturariibacter sp.]|nr:hypothetical protein [Flaviaesturariibacter sp.]
SMLSLVNISIASILPAVVLGIVRWRHADRVYRPFFILLFIGVLNEVVSQCSIHYFHTNALNSNIYVLVEALLLLWQFQCWKLFYRTGVYTLIGGLLMAVWIGECFIFSGIRFFCSYYRICYAFAVVLMSILMVNRLIVNEYQPILKSSAFLICTGFIFYYTYQVLVEIFYLYGLSSSKAFGNSIYHILSYINIFTNLIYAIAILWMPRKREFMLQL